MSDYGPGGTRPDDDYHRARQDSDRAGRDDNAWKQAQDDMFRAQREMEWQRRDAAARVDGDKAWSPASAAGTNGVSGSSRPMRGSARPTNRVSFAIADSLADSVARMTHTHPGLFSLVFRGIAWVMCWPIPIMQRFLDRRGIRNGLLRFVILLVVWMAWMLALESFIMFTNRPA
jgi:hypothetical protein